MENPDWGHMETVEITADENSVEAQLKIHLYFGPIRTKFKDDPAVQENMEEEE